MGQVLQSYHTSTEGEDYGWWGKIWHPSHFDEDSKEIPDSAWDFEIHGAKSLRKAQKDLKKHSKSKRKEHTNG